MLVAGEAAAALNALNRVIEFPPFDVALPRPSSRQMKQVEIAVGEIQRAAGRLFEVYRLAGTVAHLHRAGNHRQMFEHRVEKRELHIAVGEDEFERLDLLLAAEGGRKAGNGGFPAVDPVRTVFHVGRIVAIRAAYLRRSDPVVADTAGGVLLRYDVA